MESEKIYLLTEYDDEDGHTIKGAFTEFDRAVEMGRLLLKKNIEENIEEQEDEKYELQYFVSTCPVNSSEPMEVNYFQHKIKLVMPNKK